MDFDEYDYLEKTVELAKENKKDSTAANGGATPPRDDKERSKERRSSSGSKHHREPDEDRDSDRRDLSKRSRHDDKDLSRDRDRNRDREREKEKDRERERERSSSRHRSSSERHRDREKSEGRDRDREERHREREREREKEKERERRSRSHSERRRDDDYLKRERSRERELREKDIRERERRKKEEAEPEADPERDQRTVFAYQLSLKADERDVYEFFSRAGKVRDVRLIMDRNSRRSKGVGYIEFYDVMSVPMAIALSGQPLLGQPVMVKPSEAEKNLVQSNAASAAGASGPYSGGARRLYVGNIPYNITEDLLRQVFDPFGTVELVQLPIDPETGHGKGFGFIQFARLEDAKGALSLNGQIAIAGKTIKVSTVTEQGGTQDVKANAGDLDDDEGGGLSLDAHSRALLMQKLAARSGNVISSAGALPTAATLTVPTPPILGVTPIVNPLVQPIMPPVAGLPGSVLPAAPIVAQSLEIGVPTECLLLKNMFDPSVETEPDFDLDIKEDVQEECAKFGTLKHIFVDKNTAGHVYLRFDNVTSACNAQRALHGRWFAGKMITATFMPPQQYDAKFPNNS